MPYSLELLEAFVSSPAYDAGTAGLIALGIPELPRLKGEQIAPGITRIRGNLCNVHGKYGPCDKGLSGKKPKGGGKGRAARKPAKTDAQRAAERTQRQAERQAETTRQQALNMTKVGEATDLGDHLANLDQFSQGKPLRPEDVEALSAMGLLEIGSDGTPRKSEQANVLLNAAKRGDTQGARDAASRARDRVSATQERTTARATRQQEAATRHAQTLANREQAKRQREERAAKKPAKASAGGSKKPDDGKETPIKVRPTKRVARSSAPRVGSVGDSAPKPRPAPAKEPEKEPAKQIAPALQTAADQLSQGAELSDDDTQSLIRNGLAKLDKNGTLILTAAGMRATTKAYKALRVVEHGGETVMGNGTLQEAYGHAATYGEVSQQWLDQMLDRGYAYSTDQGYALYEPGEIVARDPKLNAKLEEIRARNRPDFRVFKDASGRYRWVAQSSTAFQDRDKEIVSTKALADDCRFADKTGSYGPLRWWHAPGLDLGDCDFNAMHGRVLIESGTFRTPAIAHKVATAADGLEISLGFLHLPTEPDASGVFHHIRRFERSLVPRGKASNRFTAFSVKETTMLDATKVAALKTLGFSDTDIAGLQAQAAATEKSADAQQVAYKADEPAIELPDVVINGVTYKAFPPSPPTAADAVIEEDAIGDMPMEEVPAEGGLTLSPEDIAAIGSAVAEQIGPAIAQVMGALDLEKKVAGHVQGLMAPYQATKDAGDAEKAEQIAQLQASLKAAQEQQGALKAQLDELLGLQPAVKAGRASESSTTTINPWVPQDAQLLESVKRQVSPDDQFAFGDLVENLFGNQTPGQA